MPNIKFSYLYRDSANYKNHGFVIFADQKKFTLKELEIHIKAKLIDETWFYAEEWNLPKLFFIDFNPDDDPTWHEFEGIDYTNERVNSSVDLSAILTE